MFFILAPLMVMYVRGLTFDFTQKKFVQTGILAVRTEPPDTEVWLDGKLWRKTSGDIRFLLPREYNLSLRKNGYFEWSKRLAIKQDRVTWAGPLSGKIFLLLNPPKILASSSNVANFSQPPKTSWLFYLAGNSLGIASANGKKPSENILLPKPAGLIIASDDSKQILLNNAGTTTAVALYVNTQTRAVTDLSGLFNQPAEWQFSPNGVLYALVNDQLYAVNGPKIQKTLIQEGIIALSFLNKDAYFLKLKDNSLSLRVSANVSQEGQEILKNLPLFKEAKIIVNFEKQVFIVADHTLYKVGSQLSPLAGNVLSWDFNAQQSSLIFFHDGELDYLNPASGNTNFITRRGSILSNPLIRTDLNLAFFVEDNKIKTLELDTRDHQNEYNLYDGTDIKKFTLDADGKILTVLDGNDLKTITIR